MATRRDEAGRQILLPSSLLSSSSLFQLFFPSAAPCSFHVFSFLFLHATSGGARAADVSWTPAALFIHGPRAV